MATAKSALPSKDSALAVISRPLATRSESEQLLREWIVKFAEIAERELTSVWVDLWVEALRDLEPEWIEFGCRAYLRSMKFFPKPGDIRELIELEKENRLAKEFAEADSDPMTPEESERRLQIAQAAERRWQMARAAGEKYRERVHELTLYGGRK
jgi:hypothetical protein